MEKINRDYIKINKRLQRIKDLGLTPVTLKSPSDITEKIIYQKGTGNEGLIMSYNQAAFLAYNERNEQLTIEEYNKSIQIFMEDYKEQTYVEGAYKEAYRQAKATLEFIENNINFFESDIDINSLSEKETVKMLQYVGTKMNEFKAEVGNTYKEFNSPEIFLQYVEQWFEEHKKSS